MTDRPPTARFGVVTALRLEAAPLGRHAGITVRVCGVAGAGIGDAVRDLRARGCRLVVSWGMAGALSDRLRAGDLVVPERVIGRDEAVLYTDAGARQRFASAMSTRRPVGGTLVESPRIAATPSDKRCLGRRHDGVAVDMESGAVGQACAEMELPFLVVRAIVDELDDRLPGWLGDDVFADGSLRAGGALARLVLHPGEWAALLRLARRYRRAAGALRAAAGGLARGAADIP